MFEGLFSFENQYENPLYPSTSVSPYHILMIFCSGNNPGSKEVDQPVLLHTSSIISPFFNCFFSRGIKG